MPLRSLRSYLQVQVEGVLYLCLSESDTRYYRRGTPGPESSIDLASPSVARSKSEIHVPAHRLIHESEPPSPASTHASPVRVAASMRPYDHLPPLERALPYLVDTLYAELDSISCLLATRPPGSLSLGDVDVISHLIQVSSDFREYLQQSHCYTYPARSCAWSPASSPPPTNSPAEFTQTFGANEQELEIVLNTQVESREEPQLRPLDLHPSPGSLPPRPPHLKFDSHSAKAVMPSTLNDGSKVSRPPRAGAWHIAFSRCVAFARGLFKSSSMSD